MSRHRPIAAAILVTSLMSSGCGEDDTVPTADDLVERAMTADALGAPWQAAPDAEPQIIGADDRADLATLDLCPDASEDDRTRAGSIPWQVASAVGTPPTGDAAFAPSLIQTLISDEPDDIEDLFELLRDGMTSCVPGTTLLPDGGEFEVSLLDLPPVGDDRFGVHLRQIDQPEGNDRWDIRQVIVRDGPVLMWLSEVEINTTSDPVVDTATLEGAVVAAVAALDGAPSEVDIQIASPASAYCEEQGGVVEIVDESDGQVGYCVLPDGRRIEEWLFFRSGGTTTVP
jgi:putative hemolysin